MATVLNTVYPPIAETYMPAFPYTESARVYFSLSTFTSLQNVAYIHVAISMQKNNKNVLCGYTSEGKKVRPQVLPIQISTSEMDTYRESAVNYDSDRGQYYIDIDPKLISESEKWTPDTFYKVQVRFQLNNLPSGAGKITDFYSYENFENCDNVALSTFLKKYSNYFSEWSTVCLLRPIWIPDIYCRITGGWQRGLTKFISTASRAGEMPVFPIGQLRLDGTCLFTSKDATNVIQVNNDSTSEEDTATQSVIKTTSEQLSSYTISIIDENGVEQLTSDLQTTANSVEPDDINALFDVSSLPIEHTEPEFEGRKYTYYLKVNCTTNNDYNFSKVWKFGLTDQVQDTPWVIYPAVDNLNGVITLRINQDGWKPGTTISENNDWSSLSYKKTTDLLNQVHYGLYDEETETYITEDAVAYDPDIEQYICLYGNNSNKTAYLGDSVSYNSQKQLQVNPWLSSMDISNTWGLLHVRRASSDTDFQDWETIRTFKVSKNRTNQIKNFILIDNTVKSLTGYKYRIQYENANEYMYKCRGIIINDDGSISSEEVDSNNSKNESILMTKFYGALFSRWDRQLHLGFDFKVSQITPTVTRVKADPLGSKYPKFSENALLNYKVLSISGTISSQDDSGEGHGITGAELNYDAADYQEIEERGTFFLDTSLENYKQQGGDIDGNSYENTNPSNLGTVAIEDVLGDEFKNWYYKKETCANYSGGEHYVRQQNDLSYNDYLLEREFREAVLAWLNDGEPKLMRTMTEGNLVVILSDVSISPIEGLSRRLYSFQATATEVADASKLEALDNLGIFKIYEEDFDNDHEMGTYEDKNSIGMLTNFCYKTCPAASGDAMFAINNHWSYTYTHSCGEAYKYKYSTLPDKQPYLKDVAIRFRSRPHWIDVNNEIETDSSNWENCMLGYLVVVGVNWNNNATTMFVPQSGYLQLPSNMNITTLKFPQMAASDDGILDIVDVNYVTHYRLVGWGETPDDNYQGRYVIGQIADTYLPGISFNDLIKNKYNYVYLDKVENGSNVSGEELINDYIWKINYIEALNYWYGVTIESNPYSIFKISYGTKDINTISIYGQDDIRIDYNDTSASTYQTINDTGYISLSDHYMYVTDVAYCGRRMFQSYNEDYLRENEFYYVDEDIDSLSSITNPKHNHVYPIKTGNNDTPYNYYIYWNDKFYSFLNEDWPDMPVNEVSSQDELDAALWHASTENGDNFTGWGAYKIISDNDDDAEVQYYYFSGNSWVCMNGDIDLHGIAMIPANVLFSYEGQVYRREYA